MHAPRLLERVRVTGMDEVYLVTKVDQLTRMADVLPLTYGQAPIRNLPFHVLEAIPGCIPLRPRAE